MNGENYDRLLSQVITEARDLKIPVSGRIRPHVRINKRARSRFGCCRRESGQFEIELSQFMENAPVGAVKQTLAHEVLHTCPGCENHGMRWNRYAEMMNRAYGYTIKRTSAHEELGLPAPKETKLPARYVLVCAACGMRIERTRMSRLVQCPRMYRCRCGGALSRIK